MNKLVLLSDKEYTLRLQRVAECMRRSGADTMVITDSANIFYLTGRVFCGWAVVSADATAATFLVKRPGGLEGGISLRKPEEITAHAKIEGAVALELDTASWGSVERLRKALGLADATAVNASAIMRAARAVKTDAEVAQIRESGVKHDRVYSRIPSIFREGMTDLELQIELERISRLEGSLGQFRISGDTMEIYMGNVLAGKNADNPTPYDFAMGGEGINPSLPVGANGTTIAEGNSIMVDMNGNFTGYMTDMTRVYSCGPLSELAVKAHNCSIRICHKFAEQATPGTPAKALYEMAVAEAEADGLADYFMGHRQKAGFVGHGVGIEINELPVIAPRSRDILEAGNIIALEPKFVVPGTGAVGIENTYLITPEGGVRLTNTPEELVDLA